MSAYRRVGLGAALILWSVGGQAQSSATSSDLPLPQWMTAWSPLKSFGDLPRELPWSAAGIPVLATPPEKVGLFWNGGNPAALPWDVSSEYQQAIVSKTSVSGDFRRPLDVPHENVSRVDALGWRPLGDNGSVIGRVGVDRTIDDPSSSSNTLDPYSSSPFAVLDTTASALRHTGATLEGAGGWRMRGWGLGVALGYQTGVRQTVSAAFTRANKAASSSANVGVLRELGHHFRVALRAHWSVGEETINLTEVGQEAVVFVLQGYNEVPPTQVQVNFYRRSSVDNRRLGLDAGGELGAIHWAAFADAGKYRERVTSALQDDPPTDLWSTTGPAGGAAFQAPLRSGRLTLTANGTFSRLSGQAEHVLPARQGLSAKESLYGGSMSLRLNPTRSGWEGIIGGSVNRQNHDRDDAFAQVTSAVSGTTSSANVNIGKLLTRRLEIAAGYSIAGYSGSATIDSRNPTGNLYLTLFRPELDLEAEGSRSQSVNALVRWKLGGSTYTYLAGQIDQLRGLEPSSSVNQSNTRKRSGIWLGISVVPRDL